MRRMERQPGDDISGYRVVRTLGRGGSGAVYLVSDEGGAQAALKLIDMSDAGARERLRREVAALQALRHPAVPRVLDAELDDAEPFVVSEFIDGPSLSRLVAERGPLPPARLAQLAEALTDALAAVHAAGVVHRDVTPANVLMGPHGPALIDFGLSQRHDDDRLTQAGLVSGTAGYVAPEVIDGADPTAASDEWALAATLAFAATGRPPFGQGGGALRATLDGDVPADVPLPLARVLTSAPQFRPSPAAVAAALAMPDADATSVLGASEVGATLVAPMAVDDAWGDQEWGDEPEEQAQWAPPRRRTVLLFWGAGLVALATVAPLIAAMLTLLLVVVARAVESAARGVRRSRERRGTDQGGIVAQTLASPWHLLRALMLTIPSLLVAAGAAALVGWLGWLATGNVDDPTRWRALVLAVAAALALALLAWGPRGREARLGAHLVAASASPTRGASVAWILAGAVLAVVCVGISTGGNEQLWWPV